jgi:hypothetical protein
MASIIPNKQLFIVTSALNPQMGVVNREDRLKQTLDGLLSLREKCPDAIILLADGSPEKVEREKYEKMQALVDLVADFSGDKDIAQFASTGRKSEAENVLMLKVLSVLKYEQGMMRLLQSVNRIYKLSGRTDIDEGFDVNEHNHFGKYVFKKRMPTWLQSERQEIFTDLLITRLFSFCPSLIDDYAITCRRNIDVIMETGVDTEHAHFFNIDSDKLIELDTIHCRGTVAGTGVLEIY